MKNVFTMIATTILALITFAVGVWRVTEGDSFNAGLYGVVGVGIMFVGAGTPAR
jgi:hypothetical protein